MDISRTTFVMNQMYSDSPSGIISMPMGQDPTSITNQLQIDNDRYNVSLEYRKNHLYYKPLIFQINKVFTINLKTVSLHIGDIIDFITRYTGIKKLIIKATKGNCGCEARRKKFNEFFKIKLPIVKFKNLLYSDIVDQQLKLTKLANQNFILEMNENLKNKIQKNTLKSEMFDKFYSQQNKVQLQNTPMLQSQKSKNLFAETGKKDCGCGAKKHLTKTVNVL